MKEIFLNICTFIFIVIPMYIIGYILISLIVIFAITGLVIFLLLLLIILIVYLPYYIYKSFYNK